MTMRLALALSTCVTLAQTAKADEASSRPEVHAIERAGVKGFFVPSDLYRDMERAYEREPDLSASVRALKTETRHLRNANRALARSASASEDLASLYLRSYMSEREAHARTLDQLVSLASAPPDRSSTLEYARDFVSILADGAIIALIAIRASN